MSLVRRYSLQLWLVTGIPSKSDSSQPGQLILAGDPIQLEPISKSVKAEKYNPGMSLINRLIKNCILYSKESGMGGYNPTTDTMS
jgi:hypothetical protein